MIERLLIANRGEIARRIIDTSRAVGVETVAVYSDADAGAAFVRDADLAVALGGNTPAESYLQIDRLLAAADRVGADAVHPGYGFLAENAEFAQAVLDAGLTFVGPRPDVIAAMGSKLEAKQLMAQAGVPVLDSVDLRGLDDDAIVAAATELGFPVLVKASAGGGGRGMRIVSTAGDLLEAVTGAAREAESAFGDGTVFAERYLEPSRHVEVQIFGDESGRVVHFHERECSIQRRHQKIIEEAPSPSLDADTRARLHAAAVRAGEAIGYTNAGTVEFILGPPAPDGSSEFFFLEVNTRLQVEHAVTEAVLGVDLVALQLQVAEGGSVPDQAQIGPVAGHAVEARLYAEDPTLDFRPSTGELRALRFPGAVRVDSAIDERGEVSRYYDPMIAKIICHRPGRTAAVRGLASALAGATVDGITTNRDLLVRTLRHHEFLDGSGDSTFLQRHDPAVLGRNLLDPAEASAHTCAAALELQMANRRADSHTAAVASGFRNVVTAAQQVLLARGDDVVDVEYRFERGRLVMAAVDGERLVQPVVHAMSVDEIDLTVGGVRRLMQVRIHPDHVSVNSTRGGIDFGRVARFDEPDDEVEPGSMVASMPGTIVAVEVTEGEAVAAGTVLVVMEAMKMELTIAATAPGVVAAVPVVEGDTVEAGTVLVVLEDPTSHQPDSSTS
ncbi:MAG: biotin carboxylase N-terminal domain-containing protein [Acidimicrobiales bacterium]